MQKKIVLLIMITGICVFATAQHKDRVKIEALKTAYITQQLNLSSEEAKLFWPIHNLYMAELKKARKDRKDHELGFEEQALNIRKKYNLEFKKVLNSEARANDIFKAERNFNRMLHKELMDRRMNKPGLKKPMEEGD